MRTALNKWSRKLHRWGAIVTIVPVAIVLTTGILLQIKKQSDWLQPPTARGVSAAGEIEDPIVTFDKILESARSAPNAGVESWADVERLDVRPGQGVAKVRANSRWEVQVDLHTGAVLHEAYRRSGLIEAIHDGSFFGGNLVKYAIFLPSGVILLCLWLTGAYLWIMPIWSKRAGQRRRAGM